jgi:hypothetical protein
VSNIDIEILRRQLDRIEASQNAGMSSTDGGDTGPPSDTWLGGRVSVDARLEALKGAIDGTRWVVGIVAIIVIGGFSFLGFQLNRLEGRVDRIETAIAAIPARLSDEFHAMRSEMAAQTSAIANSIAATRQVPASPPQIIVVPSPPPGGSAPKP